MSDVKVKFGAEDVGLEKTLKSVQTELGQLQTKVKSGDLSMSELESTMKRIGQVESLEKRLKGMGGEAAQTAPKIDKLGDEAKTMGNKAEDAGDKGGIGLGKIGIAAGVAGAAFAVGMKVLELAADAARAVVDKFGEALDLGGELNDLSARTGETAGNLLVLQRAFDNSGVGADKVGSAVNKLQKFMDAASDSSSKQAELIGSLGISMADLEGKTPTEQMQIFAQKIAGIQDPTQRAATAMEIFGKSGGELLPLFADFSGELETAQGQLGSLPGVIDRSAKAFDAISDNMNVAKGKLTEFAAGMLEGAAPALEKFSAMLAGVDAAGWGQKLGEVVMRVADLLIGAFKSPQAAIDAIGLALQAGALEFANLLLNKSIDVFNLFKNFWSSEMPNLLTNQFGTALKLTFVEGVQLFTDKILGVVQAFNQDFGGSVERVGNFFSKTFSNILNLFSSDFVQALTNPIGFVSGKLFSGLKDAAENGGITFKSTMTDGVQTTLGKLSNGLGESARQYEADYKAGTQKIGDEWDKITGSLEFSATDFFGAEPAAKRLTDKMGEIEESGKKFREEFEGAEPAAKRLTDKTGEIEESGKKFREEFEGAMEEPVAASNDIETNLLGAQDAAFDVNGNLAGAGFDLKKNAGDAARDMNEIKTIGDLIAAQDAAQPMKSFKERVTEAKAELKALKDFIGQDLSKYSIPDIAKKLGIEVAGKSQKELFDEIVKRMEEIKARPIGIQIDKEATKEDIDQIISNIAEIGYESIKVALDATDGISLIKDSVDDLSGTEKQLNLTAEGALSEISSAMPGYFKNPLGLNFDADTSLDQIESNLNQLGYEPVQVKLDAASGVENIRAELSKEIDLSLSSSQGSSTLTTISKAVDAIKSAVLSLEKKLPQPALGY
jgi:hypothetical protein